MLSNIRRKIESIPDSQHENIDFKEKYSFERRKKEAERIRKKYPERVPAIVQNTKGSSLPDLKEKKYLIPSDLTVGQFIYVIRKRICLTQEKALFLFINHVNIPSNAKLMSEMYKEYKDEDGFLYCFISGESTFG